MEVYYSGLTDAFLRQKCQEATRHGIVFDDQQCFESGPRRLETFLRLLSLSTPFLMAHGIIDRSSKELLAGGTERFAAQNAALRITQLMYEYPVTPGYTTLCNRICDLKKEPGTTRSSETDFPIFLSYMKRYLAEQARVREHLINGQTSITDLIEHIKADGVVSESFGQPLVIRAEIQSLNRATERLVKTLNKSGLTEFTKRLLQDTRLESSFLAADTSTRLPTFSNFIPNTILDRVREEVGERRMLSFSSISWFPLNSFENVVKPLSHGFTNVFDNEEEETSSSSEEEESEVDEHDQPTVPSVQMAHKLASIVTSQATTSTTPHPAPTPRLPTASQASKVQTTASAPKPRTVSSEDSDESNPGTGRINQREEHDRKGERTQPVKELEPKGKEGPIPTDNGRRLRITVEGIEPHYLEDMGQCIENHIDQVSKQRRLRRDQLYSYRMRNCIFGASQIHSSDVLDDDLIVPIHEGERAVAYIILFGKSLNDILLVEILDDRNDRFS
jgi:hypothetical protein